MRLTCVHLGCSLPGRRRQLRPPPDPCRPRTRKLAHRAEWLAAADDLREEDIVQIRGFELDGPLDQQPRLRTRNESTRSSPRTRRRCGKCEVPRHAAQLRPHGISFRVLAHDGTALSPTVAGLTDTVYVPPRATLQLLARSGLLRLLAECEMTT